MKNFNFDFNSILTQVKGFVHSLNPTQKRLSILAIILVAVSLISLRQYNDSQEPITYEVEMRINQQEKELFRGEKSEKKSERSDNSKDVATFLHKMEKRPKHVRQFVARWLHIAYNEMLWAKENGGFIPVSIKMTQGAYESGWGQSGLCQKENNFFCIKWTRKLAQETGYTKYGIYADDIPNDKFITYPSAWASWRHHSIFLFRDRYKWMHKYDNTDGKAYSHWASGLQKSGYATSKKYSRTIRSIVRTNKFHILDRLSGEDILTISNIMRMEFNYPELIMYPNGRIGLKQKT